MHTELMGLLNLLQDRGEALALLPLPIQTVEKQLFETPDSRLAVFGVVKDKKCRHYHSCRLFVR